jgi:hypothetical protein
LELLSLSDASRSPMGDGGCHRPAARELFSKTDDNPVAIPLSYGSARVL